MPDIKEAIETATFISIDTEFTGLQDKNAVNQFSTPSEYYMQMNENTNDFIIIQFGLTAFFAEENADGTEKFTYKIYNFYVYPRSRSQRFACQGEAIEFLSKHDFDFKKLFWDGVSYHNWEDATRMREELEAKFTRNETENFIDLVEIPESEKELLNKAKYVRVYAVYIVLSAYNILIFIGTETMWQRFWLRKMNKNL